MQHQDRQHAALRVPVKKAKGMLDKIDGMLAEDRYCADIVQQVNATIGLLRGLNREILSNHLHTGGRTRLASSSAKVRQGFIDELLQIANVTSRTA